MPPSPKNAKLKALLKKQLEDPRQDGGLSQEKADGEKQKKRFPGHRGVSVSVTEEDLIGQSGILISMEFRNSRSNLV
jgi:hypothetical protein